MVLEAAGVENIGAEAELGGNLLGDGELVAGDHLDVDAELLGGGDHLLRIRPRRVVERQHAEELPGAVTGGLGDTQRAEAALGEFVGRLVDVGAHRVRIGRQGQDHLHRALGDLEHAAVGRLDRRLGAFVHGVEGLEMLGLIVLQTGRILDAGDDGHVDGVLILRAGGERAIEHELVAADFPEAIRIAKRQLVLGQRARLVGAQHVDAGQFLDRREPADDGLAWPPAAGADRHGHRQHGRHRHRDGGDREHQGELQRGHHRIAAEQRHGEDERDEGNGDDDEIVADLQHRALEVAGRVGLLHQGAVLPKKVLPPVA